MIPMLPVVVAALAAGAYAASSNRPEKGVLTPARQLVFETAVNEIKDVNKLRRLAQAFRIEGLEAQAEFLENRAKLRELPQDVKSKRKETFRKAMASTNPEAIRAVAAAFERQTATGAANALREYADSLVKKMEETPINTPAPAAPVEKAAEEKPAVEPIEPAHTEEVK